MKKIHLLMLLTLLPYTAFVCAEQASDFDSAFANSSRQQVQMIAIPQSSPEKIATHWYSILTPSEDHYWELGLAGGPYFNIDQMEHRTLQISSTQIDELGDSKESNWFTLKANVLRGFLLPENSILHSIALGPSFVYQENKYNGVVREFGNPAFTNFNYTIENKSYLLLLESKANFQPIVHQRLTPFLVGAFGGDLSAVNHYDDQLINPGNPARERHLDENTSVHFAAAFGGGLDVMISPNFSLNVQDMITYIPGLKTGNNGTQPVLSGVKLNQMNQNILVGLSYRLA